MTGASATARTGGREPLLAVEWIRDHLEAVARTDDRFADYRGRITSATGSSGTKQAALWGSAPRTTDARAGQDDDLYDIVVATDVLAEGVNLQQARHIVNYDLPWNPMRLVQLHGRIDRIGSLHTDIYLRCFFPTVSLTGCSASSSGCTSSSSRPPGPLASPRASCPAPRPPPRSSSPRHATRSRRCAPNSTVSRRAMSPCSGTPASRAARCPARSTARLSSERANTPTRTKSSDSWRGAGSGMAGDGAEHGYVFCVRVADHDAPLFRYVRFPDDAEPEVIGDTLTCLAHARPDDGDQTPRVLSEATHYRAYHAWQLARDDIFAAWTEATDPRNLALSVPKPLRDAATLLRDHHPAGYPQQQVDAAIDALEAPHLPRVQREIRDALAQR